MANLRRPRDPNERAKLIVDIATDGFSKKAENHAAAVALHFMHYNCCRPHKTLTRARRGYKATPAIAAGLTDHIWTVAEVVGLLEESERVSA